MPILNPEGWSATLFLNPEGWQIVAGGRPWVRGGATSGQQSQ